ncbi:DoxX family protein [Oceanobacillus salinisoli]|uniref:DoxX family protein n=1 Tax=Oceanobacillus salinisoli TaxID=2678611 RepID=UPI0012E19970|nr:DoxX family protein [Oceanobacillus salinisoli]
MQMQITRWVCYSIGYVFITSGIVKLVINDFKVIFANLGIPYPEFTLFLVAMIEISCGGLIVARMYVQQAAAPLIFIMLSAIFLTKLPILSDGGLVHFLFEARLDIVMLMLLVVVWKYSKYW